MKNQNDKRSLHMWRGIRSTGSPTKRAGVSAENIEMIRDQIDKLLTMAMGIFQTEEEVYAELQTVNDTIEDKDRISLILNEYSEVPTRENFFSDYIVQVVKLGACEVRCVQQELYELAKCCKKILEDLFATLGEVYKTLYREMDDMASRQMKQLYQSIRDVVARRIERIAA